MAHILYQVSTLNENHGSQKSNYVFIYKNFDIVDC